MSNEPLSLLNLYEVEDVDGRSRHLVCFIDPVLAGSRGIDPRAIVGEYTPGVQGGFDLETFRPNPEFVATFTQFMNDEAARSPDLAREAANQPGDAIYIVDSRHSDDLNVDPSPRDVVGSFAVDDQGRIVPGSFEYNREHAWFDLDSGVSGLLSDRRFYGWLHPQQS